MGESEFIHRFPTVWAFGTPTLHVLQGSTIVTFTFHVFMRLNEIIYAKGQSLMCNKQNSVCSLFPYVCFFLSFPSPFIALSYILLLRYIIQNGNILINSFLFFILPIIIFPCPSLSLLQFPFGRNSLPSAAQWACRIVVQWLLVPVWKERSKAI